MTITDPIYEADLLLHVARTAVLDCQELLVAHHLRDRLPDPTDRARVLQALAFQAAALSIQLDEARDRLAQINGRK